MRGNSLEMSRGFLGWAIRDEREEKRLYLTLCVLSLLPFPRQLSDPPLSLYLSNSIHFLRVFFSAHLDRPHSFNPSCEFIIGSPPAFTRHHPLRSESSHSATLIIISLSAETTQPNLFKAAATLLDPPPPSPLDSCMLKFTRHFVKNMVNSAFCSERRTNPPFTSPSHTIVVRFPLLPHPFLLTYVCSAMSYQTHFFLIKLDIPCSQPQLS